VTDPHDVPVWEQRFRAPRLSLPQWAIDAPDRCLFVSNPTGTFELFTWDRATGEVRQATDREHGTWDGALSPDGERVWWFDDAGGDEHGVWRSQPFVGGEAVVAVPGVPAAYPAGLAIGHRAVVVGCSDDDGTTVWLQRGGGDPTVLYRSEHDASAAGLSRDETLVVLEHSEHGDSRHPALRVVDLDGRTVGELWDGDGLGLHAVGFSPVPGDARVLCLHERAGRPTPLVWDPVTGQEQRLELDLPGDLDAEWFPDGRALLVQSEARARSTLHRVDLATLAVTPVPTPPGTISGATARPDGTVEYAWSSAAEPSVVRSSTGDVVLTPQGPRPAPSVPLEDAFVEGPGGAVHALVARPEGEGPHPTVFLLHGGPTHHDTDSFAADRAAWVDLGCAVVHVNYRGSTGYGSPWRDALTGRPGLTELEDVGAVHDWAVGSGLADPARCVVTGGSWGGYLALLALGTQPERWAAGVAAVPVADYLAAYEDEMEPLRAFDRSLFGGSPQEVPDRYARSSPLTYVDAVRAPVLVIAGASDPRCPLRQIENYLAALAQRGAPHEVYRYDAGHGSLVTDERVRQVRAELAFVARHLGLPDPG
jgi:dienelactone hydrolase